MTQCTELWVDLKQLSKTRVVTDELPPLEDGEVLVAIDKFGITAMNLQYARARPNVSYWGFPTEGEWCKVPAWGYADVLKSNCAEVPVGERVYGFFPMASHAVLRPGHVREDEFVDITERRQKVPETYNRYRRTGAESEVLRAMEVERCLMFPLLLTAFMLYDYLLDNNFFGAGQVLISSASSKTGIGLAQLLRDDDQVDQHIVGLTSAANVAFVDKLGSCRQTVAYGDESQIDRTLPAAYVDMSGNSDVRSALHHLLQDNMKVSLMVGNTHWEQQGDTGDLPGALPETFFAPGHVLKREAEWGPGVIMDKGWDACVELAPKLQATLAVEWIKTADDLADIWNDLIDNKVSPDRGLMVSLR